MKALYTAAFWSLFTLTLPALGQRSSRSGVGLKAGPQWCTQRAAGMSFQPVPGALGGVYCPLWIMPRLEVQPELLVSYQGAALLRSDDEGMPLRMLYLQIPVSAKLFISNTFNAQAGLQAGKLLNATLDGEDVKPEYRSFEVGFVGGLGLDLVSGFDLTLRYYTAHTPTQVTDDDQYVTNRSLQLTAGYRVARFSKARRRLHTK